ncbi:MAG: hypothetical protein LBJ10_08740 [Clostridiales bacterium]|nr:hypothetical protein [Clostridiales bacterium]
MKSVDWFMDQKWGVFTHYLYELQNTPENVNNMGVGETSWDACADAFDAELLAGQLVDAGASYLIFTVMQRQRWMCAPNATYDRIIGAKPGEACCRRDLISDLIAALDRRGIALFLYYTGDGPFDDPVAGPAMGLAKQRKPLTEGFLANWSSVAREYSMRYGAKVRGWWVDGCYTYFGYTDQMLQWYADAMRAGNPDALLAFNNGVFDTVTPYSALDDYTCGEMNDFFDYPESRFIGGAQWHTLAPLGLLRDASQRSSAWGAPGCKRDGAYMRDYVRKVNEKGGVVSVDVALYRDGHIDQEQFEVLRQLGK